MSYRDDLPALRQRLTALEEEIDDVRGRIDAHPQSNGAFRTGDACRMSWDEMKGDHRVRFCPECQLHVYNFAALSSEEAARVIAHHRGEAFSRVYIAGARRVRPGLRLFAAVLAAGAACFAFLAVVGAVRSMRRHAAVDETPEPVAEAAAPVIAAQPAREQHAPGIKPAPPVPAAPEREVWRPPTRIDSALLSPPADTPSVSRPCVGVFR